VISSITQKKDLINVFWQKLLKRPQEFGNIRYLSWKDGVMRYEKVEVECYSGYKANERPVAFVQNGRRYEIVEILDRWYEGGLDPTRPPINYFKVKTKEGHIFLLRYLSLFDAWTAFPSS